MFLYLVTLVLCPLVFGQGDTGDLPLGSTVEQASCSGSIAGAVIVTIIILLVIAAIFYYVLLRRTKSKETKKLDPEAANRAAYDNPHFVHDEEIATKKQCPTQATIATNTTGTLERSKSTLEKVFTAMMGSTKLDQHNKTKDDQCLERQQVLVPLQGHDFAGLGFKIHGSLREGIFVKELLQRGPANESGLVAPGDRLMALTVVTDHMVFEDALTILSYASPYPVLLHLEKGSLRVGSNSTLPSKTKLSPSPIKGRPSPLSKNKTTSSSNLVHPTLRGRSQSFEDLVKIGKIDINKMKLGILTSPSLTGNFTPLNTGLPRTQNIKLVQRNFETRHSERAIDVPGVESKPNKDKKNKQISKSEGIEDLSVEVHRPMRAHVEIDMPNFDEPINTDVSSAKQKVEKTDSKTKFGVKVLPELDILKQKTSLEMEVPQENLSIDMEQNKTTEKKIEKDMDIISPIESDSDSPESKADSPSNEQNKSGSVSPVKEKKQKLGEKLSFGPFSFGKHSKDQEKTDSKPKEDKHKSRFGLNFEVPDINIPSLGIHTKSKKHKEGDSPVKKETKSTGVDTQEKDSSGDEKDERKERMKPADMTFPSKDFQKQFMSKEETGIEAYPISKETVKESQNTDVINIEGGIKVNDNDKTNMSTKVEEYVLDIKDSKQPHTENMEDQVDTGASNFGKNNSSTGSTVQENAAEIQLLSADGTIKMSDIDAQINSLEYEAFSLVNDNTSSHGTKEIGMPKTSARTVFSDPFLDAPCTETRDTTGLTRLEHSNLYGTNDTDATKKKKYGIRLDGPDLSPSSVRIGQRLPTESTGRWENNQSDEVKSLNLRARSPGTSNISISSTDVPFTSPISTSYDLDSQCQEMNQDGVLNASDEKKMKVIGVNVMPPTFNIQGVKLKRTNTEESDDSPTDSDRNSRGTPVGRMSVSEFAFSDIPVQYELNSSTAPKSDMGVSQQDATFKVSSSQSTKPSEETEEQRQEGFGSAFGFKGFRHHIDMSEIDTTNFSGDENESLSNIHEDSHELMKSTIQIETKKMPELMSERQLEVSNSDSHASDHELNTDRNMTIDFTQDPTTSFVSKEATMPLKSESSRSASEDEHFEGTREYAQDSTPKSKEEETSTENIVSINSGKSSPDSEKKQTVESEQDSDSNSSDGEDSDSKSKNSKKGSKGLRSLKGKIKSEFNKLVKTSSSSENETSNADGDTNGDKRKRTHKKKEKKYKDDESLSSDSMADDHFTSSPTGSLRENRSKYDFMDSWNSDSEKESSSNIDNKRKKKGKIKKKSEETRVISTGVQNIMLHDATILSAEPVNEEFSSSMRTIEIGVPQIEGEDMSPVNIKRTRRELDAAFRRNHQETDPKSYVVVREMKLKHPPTQNDTCDIDEVMEKVTIERKIPKPILMEEQSLHPVSGDTDGGSWGSDSDTEKFNKETANNSCSENSVNLVVSQKRSLTDSDELKRKATSLGDLSQLHKGAIIGSLLERAVSLDLKNASGDSTGLHVHRLQLPDSSATSIEEVDELINNSIVKKQDVTGLKHSSRWGTLEEALQLDQINGIDHTRLESISSMPTTINTQSSGAEGVSISNIEISGGRGASVTALSSDDGIWDDRVDDDPPSLPTSPIPSGKTTITVLDTENTRIINPKDHRGSDSNIVIVGNDSSILSKNIRNSGVQMSHFSTSQPNIISYSEHGSLPSDDFIRTIRSFDTHSQVPLAVDDNGKVTVTMVTSDDSGGNGYISSNAGRTIPPKPRNRPHSSPQEMLSFDSGISTPVVTVNNDWSHENGDSSVESDHNLSDEYITPDSSPQKSMTHITLDGEGLSGYTVREGPFSRTVIISNPDVQSTEINIGEEDLQ